MVSFRITGLAPELFRHLYGLDEAELAALGVQRYAVDAAAGFPDRVEMRDLEPGERALLLNFTHLESASPYRSSHAIFVREGAAVRYDRINEVPEVMRTHQLSLRAFDRLSIARRAASSPACSARRRSAKPILPACAAGQG